MLTITLNDELETLLKHMAEKAHTPPEQLLKDLIKRHAETLPDPDQDFFGYAGLWQGRDLDQQTLRQDAWRKHQS